MLFTVASVVGSLALLYWLNMALASARGALGMPLLAELRPATPAKWPRVSVVVPACNEEGTIEGALRSRLAEGYPDAEYLVVDDRSTDGTGAIVDKLAASDPRVVPIHVRALPEGWLGKLHAMHQAELQASGEWILFSDADIHHEAGTLARIVAYCEEQGLDHVAAFPSIWPSGFGADAVFSAAARLFLVGSRPWKVRDPGSRVSIGGGTFNLVRRSALARVGGLEPLRLEVLDDIGLGQALKWSGARQGIVNARGFIGLHYYRSVGEVVRGLEKNGFAVSGYRALRSTLIHAFIAVCELAPFALLFFPFTLAFWIGAVGAVIAVATQVAVARWCRRPLLPALFVPFGSAVLVAAGVRSMVLALRRGGIEWRGTRYSLDTLRRGRRYVMV
jgi:glycosyltransferase involved in cell wall biosynthesis